MPSGTASRILECSTCPGTVVLLFGFQGQIIPDQPLMIPLIAVPLLIQSYGIFAISYAAAKLWKVPINVWQGFGGNLPLCEQRGCLVDRIGQTRTESTGQSGD